MYKVYLDGELMYHPNVPDKLPLASGKLDLELNKAGTFKFLIYQANQMYGKIRKMRSIISVYDDKYRLFRGRVYSAKRDFYNGLQVTCEGELAFFNDTEVKPYSFEGSVEDYFFFLVTQHNEQVEEEKRFKLGRCTVTDPNGYITRANSNYPKTLNELKEKLVDLLGGYLWTREEEDGVYIDYLADFELTNTQRIKFGENLLDLEDVIKGNTIATAIRPLGAKLLDEEENETGKRLTIESVNNGVDYVYSPEAQKEYGWIYRTVIFDDVTLPGNLYSRGMAELGNAIKLNQTIELTSADLHALNREIQSFRLGRYTIVESPPHDYNDSLLTRKQSINILKPGSDSKLLLGDERQTFVDKQVGNFRDVSGSVGKMEEASNELKQNGKDTLTTIREQYTKIINDCKTIVSEALKTYSETGDFGKYKETIESRVTQLAESVDLEFEKTIQSIESVDGDLQEKYNTITTYFNFELDGLTIGQSSSPFKVVQKHDRYSMYVNDVEVLILNPDGTSHIPNLRISEQLDRFGYVETEDDMGRVNEVYVGG